MTLGPLVDPGVVSGTTGHAAPIEGSPEQDFTSQFAQVMENPSSWAPDPPDYTPRFAAAVAPQLAQQEQAREDRASLRGQQAPDAWLQQVIAAMGNEPVVDDFAIADETRDRARQIASGAWQDPETHYEAGRAQQRRIATNAPITEFEPGGSTYRPAEMEWSGFEAAPPGADPAVYTGSQRVGGPVAGAIGGAFGVLGGAVEQANATVKSVVGRIAGLDPQYGERYNSIAQQIAAQSGLDVNDWKVQANAARVLYDEIPAAFSIFGIDNKAILEAVLDPLNLVGGGFEGHLARGLAKGAQAAGRAGAAGAGAAARGVRTGGQVADSLMFPGGLRSGSAESGMGRLDLGLTGSADGPTGPFPIDQYPKSDDVRALIPEPPLNEYGNKPKYMVGVDGLDSTDRTWRISVRDTHTVDANHDQGYVVKVFKTIDEAQAFADEKNGVKSAVGRFHDDEVGSARLDLGAGNVFDRIRGEVRTTVADLNRMVKEADTFTRSPVDGTGRTQGRYVTTTNASSETRGSVLGDNTPGAELPMSMSTGKRKTEAYQAFYDENVAPIAELRDRIKTTADEIKALSTGDLADFAKLDDHLDQLDWYAKNRPGVITDDLINAYAKPNEYVNMGDPEAVQAFRDDLVKQANALVKKAQDDEIAKNGMPVTDDYYPPIGQAGSARHAEKLNALESQLAADLAEAKARRSGTYVADLEARTRPRTSAPGKGAAILPDSLAPTVERLIAGVTGQGKQVASGIYEFRTAGARVFVHRNAAGDVVGALKVSDTGPQTIAVRDVNRRQGVATRLYDAAKAQGIDVEARIGRGGRTQAGHDFTEAYRSRGAASSDRADILAKAKASAAAQAAGTTPKSAVDIYKRGDNPINNALREGNVPDALKPHVAALDEAIEAAIPLASETTVYRHVTRNLEKQLASGSLTDPAFMSVSRDAGIFKGMGGPRVLMEIRLPAGTKAADLGGIENELLLPRGSTLKVRGKFKAAVESNENTRVVVDYVASPKKGAAKTPEAKAAQTAGAERKLDEAAALLSPDFKTAVRAFVKGKTGVSPETIFEKAGVPDLLQKALKDSGAKGTGKNAQLALLRRVMDDVGTTVPTERVPDEVRMPGGMGKRDAKAVAEKTGAKWVPGENVAEANKRVPQAIRDRIREVIRQYPDLRDRAINGNTAALESLLSRVPGGSKALAQAFEEQVPGAFKTRSPHRTVQNMMREQAKEEHLRGGGYASSEFGGRDPFGAGGGGKGGKGKTGLADPPRLALPAPARGMMRQSDAQAQIAQRRLVEAQQRRWAQEAAQAERFAKGGNIRTVRHALAEQRRRIWRDAGGAPEEAIAMAPSKTSISPPHIRQEVFNDLSTPEKIKVVYNTSRALKAMGDISATLRQGSFLLVDALVSKDPVRGLKLLRTELQAFKDPEFAVRSMREIAHHPRFIEIVKKMDLKITTWDGLPEDVVRRLEDALPPGSARLLREEEFQSNVLEMLIRVPGGKKVALRGLSDVSTMSNRAFASYLNAQRWQKALNYVETREAMNGPLGDVVMRDLGRVINAWTGRGVMPHGGVGNALLNTVFFAPSFAISRGQLFVEPFIAITKGLMAPNDMLRRQYFDLAREQAIVMGKWSGTMAGMIVMFDQIPGVDIGTDTRSADFLSLKVGTPGGGQLVFDPLAGTRTIINIATRIASASTVSSRTGEETDLVDSNLLGVMDFIESFVEGKLHPTISATLKTLSRRDPYTKKEFGPFGDKEHNDLYDPRAWIARPQGYPEVAGEMFTPLLIADAIEAMVSGEGLDPAAIPFGLMAALASSVGVGVQDYEPKKSKGASGGSKIPPKAAGAKPSTNTKSWETRK